MKRMNNISERLLIYKIRKLVWASNKVSRLTCQKLGLNYKTKAYIQSIVFKKILEALSRS